MIRNEPGIETTPRFTIHEGGFSSASPYRFWFVFDQVEGKHVVVVQSRDDAMLIATFLETGGMVKP